MRIAAALIILLLGVHVTNAGPAMPNKDSLIDAWEEHIAALPSTTTLESIGDEVYLFEDSDLPFDGELTIVGALVRPAESVGYDTGYSYIGMVDFRLTDLSAERLSSQVYYYWLSDRQTLYFSDAEQRWVDTAAYQASISNMYSNKGTSFGALSFMLNYGIWIVLIALIIFAIIVLGKQAKKARSLMDDSAAINRRARENIDRAEGMQDKVLTIARETRDLQRENNELLREMINALKR